jgi:hypothetical protein
MFHVTCYGWLIFRASSLDQIGTLSRALLWSFEPSATSAAYAWTLALHAAPLLALHAFEALHDDLLVVFRLPRAWRYAVCSALLYLTLLFGDFGGAEFIYFQF